MARSPSALRRERRAAAVERGPRHPADADIHGTLVHRAPAYLLDEGAVFLASPVAGDINGVVLPVDDGWSAV